jgi:hypothetical protein
MNRKYIESEFAKAKIINNYKKMKAQKELYKADILISELFKGESLKSIYVGGKK